MHGLSALSWASLALVVIGNDPWRTPRCVWSSETHPQGTTDSPRLPKAALIKGVGEAGSWQILLHRMKI